MKHQKTTFVLAIACALCATPATASIKEECKQIKEKGETQISDWFLNNKQIAEHNKWWRDEGQEIFNKCLKKNDFGGNLDICIMHLAKSPRIQKSGNGTKYRCVKSLI